LRGGGDVWGGHGFQDPGSDVQIRRFCSTIGSLLLRRRTHSPCHRWLPFYVGFCLPLDLCLCCCLFLGEDVWQRSDVVMMVVMRGGEALVVEVIQLWSGW